MAWHPTTWVADRAIAFLRHAGDRTPFCLWASIPDPHHPFDCPQPWASLHSLESVESPLPENPEARRPWWVEAAQQGAPALDDETMLRFRASKSRMPSLSAAQTAQMVSNYYGMIALADHAVGRIVSELETLGLTENTIVVFLSDHGDLLGDHGLTLKGPSFFEGLLRVPLIVAGPGVAEGHLVSQPTSTLDLAPTLCALGAADADEDYQGESLVPLLGGQAGADRSVYCEWRIDERRFGLALDLRCVHRGDAKLIKELNSGAGELYDLAGDPGEMVNRFEDAEAADLRTQLERLLDQRPGPVRTSFDAPVGMS
jgi:arylsulfatase A-like enzyme